MATGDALSADRVNIWLAPKSTDGADLAANAKEFQSFISNFTEGGGAKDTESIYVFSDTGVAGSITRKKPREDKDVDFDIVMRFDDQLLDFTTIENEGTITPDGGGADFVVGMIAIETKDGDGNSYWKAYNNVAAIGFETEFSSEEEWKGTLKFKLGAADAHGNLNIKDSTDITKDITDATDGLVW